MSALQWCDVPYFRALIIRRSVREAKQSGAILNRCKEWLTPFLKSGEVRFNTSESTFYFCDGTTSVQFGYLENAEDEENYQGGDWLLVGFDEVTHFLGHQYEYLFSRARFGKNNAHLAGVVPVKVRSAGNPGSRGHGYFKRRFQIVRYGEEISTEAHGVAGQKIGLYRGEDPSRPFIQARLEDNPHVAQKKLYEKNLGELEQLQYLRLRWGDWDASPDSIFKQEWFGPRWNKKGEYYHLQDDVSSESNRSSRIGLPDRGLRVFHESEIFQFTTVDSAASERTGVEGRVLSKSKDQEPSWSVCSLWGMTPDFDLLWLDMIRGLWTIPNFIDRIVKFHKAQPNPPAFAIIEANGVGNGVYQTVRSKGIMVRELQVQSDKVTRSIPAQDRAAASMIWLPAYMPWLAALEDELYIWSGRKTETCDQIDTLSLAADYVAHKAHGNEMDAELASGAYQMSPALRSGLGGLQGIPSVRPSGLPRFPGLSHSGTGLASVRSSQAAVGFVRSRPGRSSSGRSRGLKL